MAHNTKLGAGFEKEMLASASPRPTRVNVERDYGGDAEKARQMQAFDRGLPTTRVFATLTDEANGAYRDQRFGYASFKGILISAARLVESGELAPTGRPNSEGQVPVTIDLSMLEKLVGMVIAHRDSLPVDRDDAAEELNPSKRHSAVSNLAFLKEHNQGVDFSESDGLMSQAVAEFKNLAFVKDADFRPVMRLASQAVTVANATVNNTIAATVRRMAETIDEEDRVADQIEVALATKNPIEGRNALIDLKKTLRAMGATDPEWKPRGDSRERQQGIGNRPDNRQRSGYSGGQRQQSGQRQNRW